MSSDDRGDPPRVAEPRRLAAQRAPEDAGPAPRALGRPTVGQAARRGARGRAPCLGPAEPGPASSSIAGASRTPAAARAPREPAPRGSQAVAAYTRPGHGRWNRHHHRRRGGQGPRPRHPQPIRRAGGRGATRRSRSSGRPRRSGWRPASATARSSPSSASTKVRPLHAMTRPQANDETAALAVRDATGDLPDRRQPAAAVVDDRRDAPRRRDPRALPPRRGRRRDVGRRVRDVAAT